MKNPGKARAKKRADPPAREARNRPPKRSPPREKTPILLSKNQNPALTTAPFSRLRHPTVPDA